MLGGQHGCHAAAAGLLVAVGEPREGVAADVAQRPGLAIEARERDAQFLPAAAAAAGGRQPRAHVEEPVLHPVPVPADVAVSAARRR